MTKRLSVKVGEYQKDGKTVGDYQEVGVLVDSDDGGQYVLLKPEISLAGLLAKQNIMALNKGENQRDMVMCGVYDNSNDNSQGQQGQQGQQSGGFSQQGQQQGQRR